MFSGLDKAISGAFASLKQVAGIRVTYRRTAASEGDGGGASDLIVVPGTSLFNVDDGAGFHSRYRIVDFLIQADELQFDGLPIEPQAGDEIVIQRPDGQHVYRVMSPGPGEPSWRFSDNGNSRLRVHTKFVEKVA